ncbi:MAG: DUF349 domain-containing protein, partial [Rikenellaceae bacterium]|nr:DUF349 domain-containing protein [Rikenellaceae bacterium]
MEPNDLNRTAPEGQFSQETETATVPTIEAADNTAVTAHSDEPLTVDFSDEEAAAASEALDNESDDTAADEHAEEGDSLTPEKLADKSKREILDIFASLLESKPAGRMRKDVEAIKIAFYKAHKAEAAAHRNAFVESGGNPDEYKPVTDESENRLKELIASYRGKRDAYLKELDSSLESNLKQKRQIIEELKELTAGSEAMGSTFNTFRELQRRWRESGPVPKNDSKDI